MVGVEWKFQQFKFGSCRVFVITNEFLESGSKEIGETKFENYSKIIMYW